MGKSLILLGILLFTSLATHATPLTQEEREWSLNEDISTETLSLALIVPILQNHPSAQHRVFRSRFESRLEVIARHLQSETDPELILEELVAASVYVQAIAVLKLSDKLAEDEAAHSPEQLKKQRYALLKGFGASISMALLGNVLLSKMIDGSFSPATFVIAGGLLISSSITIAWLISKEVLQSNQRVRLAHQVAYERLSPSHTALRDPAVFEMIEYLKSHSEALVFNPRSLLCEIQVTKRVPSPESTKRK